MIFQALRGKKKFASGFLIGNNGGKKQAKLEKFSEEKREFGAGRKYNFSRLAAKISYDFLNS